MRKRLKQRKRVSKLVLRVGGLGERDDECIILVLEAYLEVMIGVLGC